MKRSMLVYWCRALSVLVLLHLASCTDTGLEAQQLAKQAEDLYSANKYAEALPIAQRVVELRERDSGPNSPATASALLEVGRLHIALGVYAEAQPVLRRALAIRERALGAEHPDTAFAMHTLGSACYLAGDPACAEPMFRRALEIRERVLGAEHLDTAKTLNNLANLYYARRDYAGAEPLYRRVLAIREKVLGAEHPDTANVLGNLAIVYAQNNHLQEALQTYQRVLKIQEKTLGPEHLAVANSLQNMSFLQIREGDYAQAEALLTRALAIREKLLGPEHPDVAVSLNSLAQLYEDSGAIEYAEPLYRRGLAIREKTLGPNHTDTARSVQGLANMAYARKQYPEALALYERALAIQQRELGGDDPITIDLHNNAACALLRLGNYARAESLLQKGLEASRRALGGDDTHTSILLESLAELRVATGKRADAVQLFEQSLAILERRAGAKHPATTDLLSSLAGAYWSMGNQSPALQVLARAQENRARFTAQFLLTGSEARKLDYLQQLSRDAFRAVSFSLTNPERKAVELGLDSVLEYKGRALDVTSGSVARLRQSVRTQDRELFDQLAKVARQLSLLTYQGRGGLSDADQRTSYEELSARQEKLEAELSSRSAGFRDQIRVPSVADVSRAVPANAVLLEWFRYAPFDPARLAQASTKNKRYLVYVLRRDSAPRVVDIGDAELIERQITEFLTAARAPRRADVKALGRKLGDLLFGPLQADLKGIERLLVSPDGALNLVPMAALVGADGRYSLERYEISYLTSGRDLLRLESGTPNRSTVIVVAAPDYGPAAGSRVLQAARSVQIERGSLQFPALPGTTREAQAIQALLKLNDSGLLMGAAATEARVKQLHGPRILHFATHGFFLDERVQGAAAMSPLLRSGLALAGANQRRSGDEDGILTAAEAAQLDLSGTQLVVLSACESGLGQVRSGEGVFGLRRAFILAGAQSQVSSLWKVADAPTQALIEDYYGRLVRGEGRAAALRAAQLQMLARPARAHPYFWAGLIHIGNWQPIEGLTP